MGKETGGDREREETGQLNNLSWKDVNIGIDKHHERQDVVERHDRQRQLAGHLMIMVLQYNLLDFRTIT